MRRLDEIDLMRSTFGSVFLPLLGCSLFDTSCSFLLEFVFAGIMMMDSADFPTRLGRRFFSPFGVHEIMWI